MQQSRHCLGYQQHICWWIVPGLNQSSSSNSSFLQLNTLRFLYSILKHPGLFQLWPGSVLTTEGILRVKQQIEALSLCLAFK